MNKEVAPVYDMTVADRFRLLQGNRGKMVGGYFVIAAVNVGLFIAAAVIDPTDGRWQMAVSLTLFGLMGIFNLWIFYKKDLLSARWLPVAKPVSLWILFVGIALLLFVVCYLVTTRSLITSIAGSSAFVLPLFIYQCWQQFMQVPPKAYPVWQLPLSTTSNVYTAPSGFSSMQVQLKICRSSANARENIYPVTTAGKMKLGRLFERFISDTNKGKKSLQIEIQDEQSRPFAWQFFEIRWKGCWWRALNPSVNLFENGIRENAVILVIRRKAIA